MAAIISECGKYRYRLDREVQPEGKVFAYFGINPSTADAIRDDQTVKKWIGFTLRNGGRKFIAGNVFSYRATKVTELASAPFPHGPQHLAHLLGIVQEADVLVPCWGSRDKVPKNLHAQIDLLLTWLIATGKPVMCFGVTASGDPKHPQMLGYSTELVPWS